MGKFDSSKTRVEPVFGKLIKTDKTGRSWLPKLLTLPIGGNAPHLPADCDYTIHGKCCFGKDEKNLAPPVALLSWLIRHPQDLSRRKAESEPGISNERSQLLDGSNVRLIEALSLLAKNPRRKNWHIFEGETRPDVYIETEDVLVVIEGKRTETRPTTDTTWMPVRHQMLRHIDCAWEIRGKKQVIGFFIVEGKAGGEQIPAKWQKFATDTIGVEAIASSLPHRGPDEQHEIASCFAGVTTWRKVCRELGVDESIFDHNSGSRATS